MKILWICPLFLHPTTKGGQIRTLETLKQLHRRHEVHFAALWDPEDQEGPARAGEYSAKAYPVRHVAPGRNSFAFYAQALGGFVSSIPVAVSRYRSAGMRQLLSQLVVTGKFDAIVCDFLAAAPNVPNLKDAVLFQHNVETTIWERHAATEQGTLLHQALYRRQAQRMFDYERRVCNEVRRVIAVSEVDAERIRTLFGVKHVGAVPTGVDTDFFAPQPQPEPGAELVFVGSMDWSPNVDGMQWFAEAIWPLIKKELPGCRVAVVGRRPPRAMEDWAKSDPSVTVTGTVPDVRPYLWGGKVSIVPLRIGGGTRIKIYEAMAAGLPVVSTAVGAEGLPLTHGRDILLADEPEAFARECVALLRDPARAVQIGQAGRVLVARDYSWDTAARAFEKLL